MKIQTNADIANHPGGYSGRRTVKIGSASIPTRPRCERPTTIKIKKGSVSRARLQLASTTQADSAAAGLACCDFRNFRLFAEFA